MDVESTAANVTNLNATSGIMHDLRDCPIYSIASNVFKIIAYLVISLFSLIGNAVIIALFARGREQRKLDPFIISIAVSDLLMPFFAGVRELNTLFRQSDVWLVRGDTGNVLCKLTSYLADISPIVSILSMTSITVHQFVFLTFMVTQSAGTFSHTQATHEKIVTYVVVALTWIIALGFNGHYFHTFGTYSVGDDYYCDGPYFVDQTAQKAYLLAVCITFIIIPFALISILNIVVTYKVRQQMKRSTSTFPHLHKIHVRKQKRNQIMVVTMILVFALCWGPLGTAILLYTFKLHQFHTSTCSYAAFQFVSLFLAHCNAAINPWIYLFFFVIPQRQFRMGFSKSLTSFMASRTRRRRRRRKIEPANIVETAT